LIHALPGARPDGSSTSARRLRASIALLIRVSLACLSPNLMTVVLSMTRILSQCVAAANGRMSKISSFSFANRSKQGSSPGLKDR
jgi:hypothetical protein